MITYTMNKSITSLAKTFLAVLFIALTAVSCSEDDVLPLTLEEELGELRIDFKYNGASYHMANPITTNSTYKEVDAAIGSGTSYKRMTFLMPLNPTVGIHFIGPPVDDNAYSVYYISEGNNVDMLADSGTINITTVTDDYVKGTFTFSGPNGPVTVNVTEGVFLAER